MNQQNDDGINIETKEGETIQQMKPSASGTVQPIRCSSCGSTEEHHIRHILSTGKCVV